MRALILFCIFGLTWLVSGDLYDTDHEIRKLQKQFLLQNERIQQLEVDTSVRIQHLDQTYQNEIGEQQERIKELEAQLNTYSSSEF